VLIEWGYAQLVGGARRICPVYNDMHFIDVMMGGTYFTLTYFFLISDGGPLVESSLAHPHPITRRFEILSNE